MPKVALITIIHDPDGMSIPFYKNIRTQLEDIYSELYITISQESSLELKDLLEKGKFKIKVIPKRGVTHARHEVLAFGTRTICKYFHYCDFDRLLTWASMYPDELSMIVKEIPNYQYVIFGRTERAFNTHPIEWIETEKIVNKIFSLEFGQNVDITAGSCGFSRTSGEYIQKYSQDKFTDAEWPLIIERMAKFQVGYEAVNGLEYQDEISGHSKLSSIEEWVKRLELSYLISQSVIDKKWKRENL